MFQNLAHRSQGERLEPSRGEMVLRWTLVTVVSLLLFAVLRFGIVLLE